MDPLRIAVRALVAYGYLLFMTRATGKRVVSQATPIDLMVSLIVGDLIDDMFWAEVSVAKFAVAVAAIVVAELGVKAAAHRWAAFQRLVNGAPAILVRDGREDPRALRGQQMNRGDLEALVRNHGLEKCDDIKLALLENDQELSVILRPEAEPAQKEDRWRVSPAS